MTLYGLDFTSTPTARKPVTCVRCELSEGALELAEIETFGSLKAFEGFLQRQGPWTAGVDAPFGQPRKLTGNLGLPQSWEAYAAQLGELSRAEFVALLDAYRAPRPAGDKEHRRRTDISAGALSPMKVYGVPVGKMFHELAPRLARSPLNVPLLRPTEDARTVLETYPGFLARRFIGRRSYKCDVVAKQSAAQQVAREDLLSALLRNLPTLYGLRLSVGDERRSLVGDPKADILDALLCAVQVARATGQPNYGIPEEADALEGWIVGLDERRA